MIKKSDCLWRQDEGEELKIPVTGDLRVEKKKRLDSNY